MKKNLKKALSAVIALAVAVSMIPASFAAKLTLTDVADTASYATAVNTLVALDIINGYEDDSFKPDNLITRAETTKVVIAALNKINVAEGMKGDTGFADIEAKHEWATGYINAGVAEGFINGMENNTFGPDLNVTYAQIVTMLVRALGYEDYAKYMGGYPNGYLAIGNSEGITKGVSAGANTAVTRAQVASLVYNALNTPIVATTGMTYSGTAGGFVPTIEKFDGDGFFGGQDYRSLLTDKFDAYFVEGYITDNHNSDSSLAENEVKFAQAYGEDYGEATWNWTGARATSAAASAPKGTIKVGYTDAADFNGSYVKAIVKQNENLEWEFVSVETERNITATVDADLLNDDDLLVVGGAKKLQDKTTAANLYDLRYFTSESATNSAKYSLARDNATPANLTVDVYVNGTRVAKATDPDATIRAAIEDWVLNNKIGKVQLVDTFQTDGYYDAIYVDWYATAQVKSISSSGKISLAKPKNFTNGNGTSITLDPDDDKISYHIYYNGEEISVSDLKIDDVISIAYDVDPLSTFGASSFYDIYVSREVVTDTLNSIITDDEILEFANAKYKLIDAADIVNYTVGNEYTLYIDAFGRILTSEKTKTSDKYALVDKFSYNSNDGLYKLYLYTADGAAKTYSIQETKAVVKDLAATPATSVQAGVAGKDKYDVINEIGKNVYNTTGAGAWVNAAAGTTGTGTAKQAVENRVIKYQLSSAGYINSVEFLKVENSSTLGTDKFNSKINSIGSVKMDSATKVVDAMTYEDNTYDKISDLALASLSNFVDDKTYEAYAYGDKADGAYPFVIVKQGPKTYDENTRFAVVAGAPGKSTLDGDDIYTLPVYYKGASNDEVQVLNITDDLGNSAALNLKIGDIIVFNTTANGLVEKFYEISQWAGNIGTYATIRDNFIAGNDYVNITGTVLDGTAAGTVSDLWKESNMVAADFKRDEVTVAFGVILGSGSNYLTLGKINNAATTETVAGVTYGFTGYTDQKNTADYVDVGLSSETNVYMYDYSASSKNRLSVINKDAIPAATFNTNYIYNDVIAWDSTVTRSGGLSNLTDNTNLETANFAYVLVAGGEALDVLVLAAK